MDSATTIQTRNNTPAPPSMRPIANRSRSKFCGFHGLIDNHETFPVKWPVQ